MLGRTTTGPRLLGAATAALFLVSSVTAVWMVARDQGSEAGPPAAMSPDPGPDSTHHAPPEMPPDTAPDTSAGTGAPSGEARVVVSERGVVLPVRARHGGGYRVGTPCSNTALVRGGKPVAGADVVLDPGHGGAEDGAVGPNGLTEKALNLAVARHAQAALERHGLGTVLTRTADYRMTLGARAEVAKALRPRAFVSVHHNSEPDGPRPGPGTETFYQVQSPSSKRLAGLVYEEVVKALSAYQVAWVADRDAGAKFRTNSRGGDYYGILRQTAGVTGVLAELAYVSNPAEAQLLARPDVQQVEGEAVARGIVRFLTTSDPGSGYVTPYPRTEPAGPGGSAAGCVDPPL